MIKLEGKIACITGTSGDIGSQLALALARAGTDIVHLNRTRNFTLEEEIAANGQSNHYEHCNLEDDPEAISESVNRVLSSVEQVDILVNNAGVVVRKPIAEQSISDLQRSIAVNLFGPMLLTKYFGQHMMANGSGKIINILSMMSFQGGVDTSGYVAGKTGLAGFTKAAANEFARFGVNVNGIAPGYIETAINSDLRSNDPAKGLIDARIPQGRWGEPNDLVGGCLFLASSMSDYVNGHVLAIDGGWLSR